MNLKLTPERLLRKALVYIRQSKPSQLIHNQESTRLQLSLADRARSLGFQRIMVIDDDLGRTGSGLVDRPGFQRLAAEVCSGDVGAVFCVEASRLARNGRDWHYLIELCGMVGAVVVDLDGIYDPALTNDRLLLGMKGTISEFELNLFRQRSTEAIRQKAARGELQIQIPVGFCWAPGGKLEKIPTGVCNRRLNWFFVNSQNWGASAKFYYGFGTRTFACQHFLMTLANAKWFGNCRDTLHYTPCSPSPSTQAPTYMAKPRLEPRS